ncbi:ABSCISIC ACID-INSENSITIVE 5 isoform X1 [Olea europaea subsp. europaea]|uniref:ABSCISIC ACID-INSENSITIVE 5 isoform X1 n=1 Tax=Olea europaea subsp. europaea TaxID=158383 RepID=A0A8S0UWP5_OLEEU|nr:ABSCISIC ACID-INSENSITIVE 5 isoform X1 [Olea europaea subsp. europaea]
MDQFLHSIWIAEENQATNTQAASATANGNNVNAKQNLLYKSNAKGIPKQTNLPRQGSLSIQKIVDEVWSDIHKDQQQDINDTCVQNPNTTQRWPTFEEMALEDFLRLCSGVYFVALPVMGLGCGNGGNNASGANVATYQALPQSGAGKPPCDPESMKRGVRYTPQPSIDSRDEHYQRIWASDGTGNGIFPVKENKETK